MLADHRRLRELTEAFIAAVRRLHQPPQDAEPNPQKAIREFTQHYRQHMRSEEEQFFRLAERRLSPSDWATLDFTLFDRDDPLFDHVAEARFTALRQRIEQAAEDRKARRSVLEVTQELRQLSGVESFNASMRSAGRPFRLARFAEGGFALERSGQLLLYVPECSEERAAWCAYCYLRAAG